jgi:proline iminopeptidase
MKKLLLGLLFISIHYIASSQSLYSKAYGKATDKPIIFLHGGPGYNCVGFEVSTAQALANKGFYVIVYDRRGEGRSIDDKAQFTFQEAFDDLEVLCTKYKIKKPTLIGHSFGGMVATLFAEKYPSKINSIVLVGSPMSLQESFKYILTTCKSIYTQKQDTTQLKFIAQVEKMDTTTLRYSSMCFQYAMSNGAYSTKTPNEESKAITTRIKADSLFKKYASTMQPIPTNGFSQNEKYTTLNMLPSIKNIVSKKTKIFALYGKEDGLYSPKQIEELQKIVGTDNLKYFDNCSHNVFINQQTNFITSLVKWVK